MTKKILVSIPEPNLERANWIAAQEGRTRSDLIREAMRDYERKYKANNPGVEVGRMPDCPKPGVM